MLCDKERAALSALSCPPVSTHEMLSTKGDADAAFPHAHPPPKVREESFVRWTQASFAGAALILRGFPTHRW